MAEIFIVLCMWHWMHGIYTEHEGESIVRVHHVDKNDGCGNRQPGGNDESESVKIL